MEQPHPTAQALLDNEARRRMWEDMFLKEGWRELVQYLEKRYLELNTMDCDSLVKLHKRNGGMDEIKKLFAFITHDFKVEEVLIKNYQSLMDTGALDDLPPPQGW